MKTGGWRRRRAQERAAAAQKVSTARLIAGVAIAGLLIGPIILIGFFPGMLPERDGTPAFYSAAAQAIPTLLVALAIELQVFVKRLRHFVAIDAIVVLILVFAFGTMALGEFAALDVLSCDPFSQCANVSHFQTVFLALIYGTTLVLVTFVLALYHGTKGPQEL